MSTYDDPNREAVGLEPIWTSAGEAPPEPGVDPPAVQSEPKPKAKPEAPPDEEELSS